MSYAPRPTNTYPSTGSQSNAHSTSNTSSSLRPQSQSQTLLQTRINAKRAELENLRHLRNLSATLATQLSTLEQRLGTLKDGAQSVALVLANWDNVLKAISMAAMKIPGPAEEDDAEGEDQEKTIKKGSSQALPVPLVRIPLQPETDDVG